MEVAVSAARWVVSKALGPVTDGLLEAWAASAGLGPNIDVLKMELLYAQGMLDNAQGRNVRSPALEELLYRLRRLAYDADDVLDELDYFRIQDALDGTYHAADVHAGGCVHGLVLNARHTAKAVASKLKPSSCSREISSTPPPATDQGVQEVDRGCMPKVASSARDAAHAAGKHFPCYSFPSVHDDAYTGTLESSNMPVSGRQRDRAVQTPKLKFDRVEMSRKMKDIVEQLKPVCAKVSTILNLELLGSTILNLELLGSTIRNLELLGSTIRNLELLGSNRTTRSTTQDVAMNRPKTTPAIIEPKLYGRESQKKSIADSITHGKYCANKLIVLPIVGPGGIGKTTFTQHLYEEVKSHFQVPVWICVSLDFNANRLLQEIEKKIPNVDGEKGNCSEELIEQRLQSKRFLLVLDDMWTCHEEEWRKLLAPFKKGGIEGTMVIVTTRIPEVANMVRSTTIDCSVELERLSPEDIMCFFEACVFGDQQPWKDHADLHKVGSEIVEKLKGSPLAAKTVGRLLRNNLTLDHWTRVLESKEWESQTGDHDIMPALKLSYDYLSFPLQQCFAYCALFPEDYKFDSEELIRFWIGLDILRPGYPSKRIEDTGLDYLNDLVNYGFFKRETDEQDTYYIIHDLLHDLALKVSSQECLTIDSSRARHIDIAPSICHLSINMSRLDGTSKDNFSEELGKIGNRLKSESLHTLMLFGEYDATFVDIFRKLFKDTEFLRVVHLSRMSYPVESILPNFSKLLHLRYLRLGSKYGSKIHLPSSLSRLYHLRILDMRGWHGASYLPGDLSNLVKLRHFIVPNDYDELHSNISNVGKLHCLQELRRFQVKKENGIELRELGQLAELRGSLSIYNIEHVQVDKAGEAKLLFKDRLQKLTLNWDKGRSNKDPDKENQVLENLRPNSNIRELCIDGHGGPTCPTWLGTNLSVKGLEALRLDGVAWKTLPQLGELCLIDESGNECFGCITGGHFHHLKRLELVSLPNLKKWVAKEACPMLFCTIEVLIVEDCSKLVELPFSHYTCYPLEGDGKVTSFPNLREFRVRNSPNLLVPPIPWTNTLCFVEIRNMGSSLLDKLTYSKSSSEVNLEITGKDDEINLEITDDEVNLEITGKDGLHSLDEVLIFKNLTELQELEVSKCTANGKELTQLLSHLPKLSYLSIWSCQKIERLGVVVEQQQTTAPVSSPSSSAVKLEDTQATDEQQQITEELEEEKAAVEPVEKEEDGLLLFPAHLSNSLRNLSISSCEELSLVAGDLQALRSLQSLDIRNCPKFLSDYNTSSCCLFPSSLQNLHLSEVEGMKTLEPLSDVTSLQSLYLYRVEGMKTLEPLSNLTSLQSLHLSGVEGMKTLEPLSNLTSLQSLHLSGVEGMKTLEPLSNLTSLQYLYLSGVEGTLEPLSNLTSLQYLDLSEVEGMKTLEPLSNITSLIRLEIRYCGEDLRGEGLWPLLTQGQLNELEVIGSPNFFAGSDIMRGLQEEEQRPLRPSSKLRELDTCDIAGLLVAPICTFLSSSLTNLNFHSNKEVERFTKKQEKALQLLTSLQELQFWSCNKLERLPAGLHGLANLKRLLIYDCPAIRSLPKGGLPSSLQELDVCRCGNEELKQRCRKLMGTIPKISL